MHETMHETQAKKQQALGGEGYYGLDASSCFPQKYEQREKDEHCARGQTAMKPA